MDPLRSRTKMILELALLKHQNNQNTNSETKESSENKEDSENIKISENKENSENNRSSENKENVFDSDDGDFSPVSDDDKPYTPLKKYRRSISSLSRSSSSSPSSSSSSFQSGPIYLSSQYVSAIRRAKKRGTPFTVNEMGCSDCIDIKQLPVPRLNKSINGEVVKMSDIKVIKISTNEENEVKIEYKISYLDDFKELDLNAQNTRNNRTQELKQLYQRKLDLSERKKNDVRSLLDAGLIPSYYNSYFQSIF